MKKLKDKQSNEYDGLESKLKYKDGDKKYRDNPKQEYERLLPETKKRHGILKMLVEGKEKQPKNHIRTSNHR